MDSSTSRDTRKPLAWASISALVLAAMLVYAPWRAAPFDMIDFSELIPLLTGEQSFGGRIGALARYFSAEHGRMNVLNYTLVAAKWSILGENPVLWQWSRFAELSLVTTLCFLLLLRLRLGVFAALLGSSVFLWSKGAVDAWIRLTAIEPLGFSLVIAAAFLALKYETTTRWRESAITIATLLGLALLAKETLVGCVPFILALGVICGPAPTFHRPRWTARTGWLLGSVAIAVALVLIAVFIVWRSAPESGFASVYGDASISVERWSALLGAMLLPGHATSVVANLLFLAILIGGAAAAAIGSPSRSTTTWILFFGFGLPIVGALIHLPWPYYDDFYGLPYAFGPALLLAASAVMLASCLPRLRGIVHGVGLCLLVALAVSAQPFAARQAAVQRLNADVAKSILRYEEVDSLIVIVAGKTPQAWAGAGATLRRYALLDAPTIDLPKAVEATCAEVENARPFPGPVLVIDHAPTCLAGRGVEQFRVPFTRSSVLPPHMREDSVWVHLHMFGRLD